MMTVSVICYNCSWPGHPTIDVTATQQPWIWAVGPGTPVSSQSQDASINKHSSYGSLWVLNMGRSEQTLIGCTGTFFIDMPSSRADVAAIPSLRGKSNVNVKSLPASVSVLILIHAICLAGSFFILFPVGVIALRWFGSFRFHWILQIVTTVIILLGSIIAVVFSIMDPVYASFNYAHQILGLVAVVAVVGQSASGYAHHRIYAKVGARTWVSYSHIWLGRLIIILGMLDTVLYVPLIHLDQQDMRLTDIRGFTLARSNSTAIVVAIVAIIILAIIALIVYFGGRRKLRSVEPRTSPSSEVALQTHSDAQPGGDRHDQIRADGPPISNRRFV